ncbi:MAG: RNase P subunit p30 family protein [Candidatus Woesearchaeota archaeon]
MRDIVFPNNNEEEFLKIAEKLGYDELMLVYHFDEKNTAQKKELEARILDLKKLTKIKIYYGMKANKNNIINAKKMNIITLAESNREDDRWIIEKGKPAIIYNLEKDAKKDFIHQRNSGLNQVLCKLMKENDVGLGISLSAIIEADKKEQGRILGRIMQNIRLAMKYKLSTSVGSFCDNPYHMRGVNDIISLLSKLGMNQSETKKALQS